MTDDEKLETYRTALCQVVKQAGGYLRLPEPTEDLGHGSGTLMNRPTDDGGIEFRYENDRKPS